MQWDRQRALTHLREEVPFPAPPSNTAQAQLSFCVRDPVSWEGAPASRLSRIPAMRPSSRCGVFGNKDLVYTRHGSGCCSSPVRTLPFELWPRRRLAPRLRKAGRLSVAPRRIRVAPELRAVLSVEHRGIGPAERTGLRSRAT